MNYLIAFMAVLYLAVWYCVGRSFLAYFDTLRSERLPKSPDK